VTVALGFFACANPPCTCATQALFPEQWQRAMFSSSSTSWMSVIRVTNLLISSAGYGAMSSCVYLVAIFRCCFYNWPELTTLSLHVRYVPLSNLLSVWWIKITYFGVWGNCAGRYCNMQSAGTYEGWNFNSGNYLFTTDTK